MQQEKHKIIISNPILYLKKKKLSYDCICPHESKL